MKWRDNVTAPSFEPEEPECLPLSNTTIDKTLRAVSIESPDHYPGELAEGGGSVTNAVDAYQPGSHPSTGDSIRVELPMTEQGISELDAPQDEKERDNGNLSNETLHDPVQSDAFLQGFGPTLGDTFALVEDDAPADEKEMDTRKLNSKAFHNSAHLEGPANEDFAIADSQYLEQTLDFISHRIGSSSVEVGTDSLLDKVRSGDMENFVTAEQPGAVLENQLTNPATKAAPALRGDDHGMHGVDGGTIDSAPMPRKGSILNDHIDGEYGADVEAEDGVSANCHVEKELGLLLTGPYSSCPLKVSGNTTVQESKHIEGRIEENVSGSILPQSNAFVGESFDSLVYVQGAATQEQQGRDRRLTVQTYDHDSQEEVESSTLASQTDTQLVCHRYEEVGTPPPPPPSKKRRSSRRKAVDIVFDFSDESAKAVCEPSTESYPPEVGTPPPPPPLPKKKKKRRGSKAKEPSTSLDIVTAAPASTTDILAEAVVLCPGESQLTEPRFLAEVKLNNMQEVDPRSPLLTWSTLLNQSAWFQIWMGPKSLGLIEDLHSTKYVVSPSDVPALDSQPPSNRQVLAELSNVTDVDEGGAVSSMKNAVGPILQAGNLSITTQQDPLPGASLPSTLPSMMPLDEVDTSESFPMSPGLLLDSVMFFKTSLDEPHVEIRSALAEGSLMNEEVTDILLASSNPRSEEEQPVFYDDALLLKSSSECSERMGASNVAWTKPPSHSEGTGDYSGDCFDDGDPLSARDIGLDANTREGSTYVSTVETCQQCATEDNFHANSPHSEKETKSVHQEALVDGKQMFPNDANDRNMIVMPATVVMAPAVGTDDADACGEVESTGVSASKEAIKLDIVPSGVSGAPAPTVIADGISADGWDVRSIVDHPPESTPAALDCDAAAWDASQVIFDASAVDSGDFLSALEDLDSIGPTPDNFASGKTSDCAEAQLDRRTNDVSTHSHRELARNAADAWNHLDFEDGTLLKYQGAGNAHFAGAEEGRPTQSERIEAYNSNVGDSSSCDESGDDDSDGECEVVQYVPHEGDEEIGIENVSERQEIIVAQFPAAGVATFDAAAAVAETADSFVIGPLANEKQIKGDLWAVADSPLKQIANFRVDGERPNINETEKGGSPGKIVDVEEADSTSRHEDEFPVHGTLAEGKGRVPPDERIGTCESPDDRGASDDVARTADANFENCFLSKRKIYVADSLGTGVATFRGAEALTDSSKHEEEESTAGSATVVQDFVLRSSTIAIETPLNLNSVAPSVEKRQIPLLAPPPEEKFKKWEEGRLAPFKRLEAIQNNARTVNLPLDSPDKTSLFDGQSSEAHREKSNPNVPSLSTAEGSQPELVINVESLNAIAKPHAAEPYLPLMTRLQMRSLRDGRSFVNDVGVELLSKTSSFDKSVRAGDGKIVIGEKMAEKVAIASSVAAERLEECLVAKTSVSKSINVESKDVALRKTFSSAADADPLNGKYYLSQSSEVVVREGGNDGDALPGGAFSEWKDAAIYYANNSPPPSAGMMASGETVNVGRRVTSLGTKTSQQMMCYENHNFYRPKEQNMSEDDLAVWLRSLLLQSDACEKAFDPPLDIRSLLDDDVNFENLCAMVAAKVSQGVKSKELEYRRESPVSGTIKELIPFSLASGTQRPAVMAANFVSFVQRIGKLTGIASPFKNENPFVLMVVGESMVGKKEGRAAGSVQQLVFEHGGADAVQITGFFYDAVRSSTAMAFEGKAPSRASANEGVVQVDFVRYGRRYEKPPETNPSPFENAGWTLPSVVLVVIGFLGDPVAVCRMKMVNRFCKRIISENEHTVMRDAVRAGGMSMNVRPAFWLWVTLEKCGSGRPEVPTNKHSNLDHCNPSSVYPVPSKIAKLAQRGREGPWHRVIKRDVTRAFGNMPPHKTGAKLRADSIVRALVTFGQGRLIKRGVKGGDFHTPEHYYPWYAEI
ncbi:hypothetical protein MHU86_10801 [Fragilaria crotonensis]|nr:hypothetical protein MHU86_10801 [Fragilaria crotonensis]